MLRSRAVRGAILLGLALLFLTMGWRVVQALVVRGPSETEQRLVARLKAEEHAANQAMVEVESELLGSLRWMVGQNGIGEAIAAGDVVRVREALTPQLALTGIELVDIFAMDGKSLASLRAANSGISVEQSTKEILAASPLVRNVLGGVSDALGEKFAGLVELPSGAVIYVTSPVRIGNEVVGAVAVGLTANRVLARLRRSVRVDMNLYSRDGRLLATTLPASGRSLDITRQQAANVLTNDVLISRRVLLGGRDQLDTELLGTLEVRGAAAAALGLIGREERAPR